MSRDQRGRAGGLALLGLPVLCCVGHAVLLAAGVGSLTAVTGAAAGSALLGAAGLAVLVGALAAVLLRRRRQR
jgi:LPXTG-motif cell wall-anchored protein